MDANRLIQRITRAAEYAGLLTKHFLLKPIAQLVYGKRCVWLISERGTDARDNGYHFFRYVRENHPEQSAYYIIDRQSADYPRVAMLGNVVQRESLKHWLLFLAAEMRISTHINGCLPEMHWRYCKFASHTQAKAKVVFLQHGVTKDNIEYLHKKNTSINLFISGAKPEYDYVLSKFGYSENEVKYTGFARFDQLHHFTAKRQVLIMPTWRDWLSPNFSGSKLSETDVENSIYVQSWRKLLENKQLYKIAQEYNVQFVFYPHYEMQPFLHLFGKGNDQIIFADFAHFDVQQLIKESMLLITDYSSVFFDFAYMQKPVLYYQFDEDEYRAHHYAQGYFDYRRDGFGEVVTEEADMLVLLAQYLENSCRMKAEYQSRIQRFFPLHDENNCERIYQEIKSLS